MEQIFQNANGSLALLVPIDHAAVLQCRPADYVYALVEKRILKDEGAIDDWLEVCRPYIDAAEFGEMSFESGDDHAPCWNNGYFSGDDARCLVAMLRCFNPQRYVEIGSGNSTKFARWAIEKWGLQAKITCIDPVPRAVIEHVADEFVQKSLLEVDNEIFESLESGDILFHDGSHIVFNGTDTTKLFLEVLPLIKPGVVVHIHDISLPWENVSSFDNRGYNEQYILATMLLFSTGWEVLAPLWYMHRTGRLRDGGMSFWMRKR
jgi:hypothetical protein